MIFRTLYGVDLGTDTIKLRDKSGKKFLECRNMVAVRNDGRVLAVGDDAYEMFEKNPEDVDVSAPMSGGVIASATNMELVLTDTLRKFTSFTTKSSGLCLAVPSNLTPVEQRAFFNVLSTGRVPGRVRVVEKGIADGASIGLSVLSSYYKEYLPELPVPLFIYNAKNNAQKRFLPQLKFYLAGC